MNELAISTSTLRTICPKNGPDLADLLDSVDLDAVCTCHEFNGGLERPEHVSISSAEDLQDAEPGIDAEATLRQIVELRIACAEELQESSGSEARIDFRHDIDVDESDDSEIFHNRIVVLADDLSRVFKSA